MGSRMVKTMIFTITGIVIIGAIVFIILFIQSNHHDKAGKQSLNEMVEYSVETPEVTTDLKDGSYVKIQFKVITDGKKAKEEVEKRKFQLKNILIKELSEMKKNDFRSGLSKLESNVKTKINDVLTKGSVTNVYTISKILQ